MYIQDSIELIGAKGKTYTFDLYSKSDDLPEEAGIYILLYCHPRGHLAGLKVNTLHIGITENLHSAVVKFRDNKTMQEKLWNYTGILLVKQKDTGLEYLNDLVQTFSHSMCS